MSEATKAIRKTRNGAPLPHRFSGNSKDLPTSIRNLQEGVACHVLNTGMLLLHKLKELHHHRPQEAPVVLKEARVGADDVHDVTGNHCLVILLLLVIAELQQLSNNRY